MEYNFLSDNCGLKVSNICLGTMLFGTSDYLKIPGQAQEKESHDILDRFVELGGNFLDTANMYNQGQSETIIGTWLKKRQNRSKMIIATKLCVTMDPTDPNGRGLSRKHIMDSVEQSLTRLQTDYIDLYQIHIWDKGTPIKETLATMNDLVRSGKVRYVGACNMTEWQLQKIIDWNEFMGYYPWVTLQQQVSLLCRLNERGIFEVCKDNGIGVLPYSPLKGGLLTGKVRRDNKKPPKDSRMAAVKEGKLPKMDSFPNAEEQSEQIWDLIDVMDKISKAKKKSIAQIALRWCLQTKPVASVIIGAKNIKQLEDNCAASSGWKLTEEEMSKLDAASTIPLCYPYDVQVQFNDGRTREVVTSRTDRL